MPIVGERDRKGFVTNSSDRQKSNYIIPASLLLRMLGIERSDLNEERTTVRVEGLKKLISVALHLSDIDEEGYLSNHSDVRAALLAGVIASGREHYQKSGYFENRLPGHLSFDPVWYRSHYPDIAQSFQEDQVTEMRNHFLNTGYAEGRVATEQDAAALLRWGSE